MKTDFLDLERYGIIGNLETCALIGSDGSIDWLCFPYLDSPSIFAGLLDLKKGGYFQIAPSAKYTSHQTYVDKTNILQTVFATATGAAIITDFMPVKGGASFRPSVFRRVQCIDGWLDLKMEFQPRFQYANVIPRLERRDDGVVARWREQVLFLQANTPSFIDKKEAHASFSLRENETVWFFLHYGSLEPVNMKAAERLLSEVVSYWQEWSDHGRDGSGSAFLEKWHDLVVRSGLVLKLLSDHDTGAFFAAATTSLPEEIGGKENWDYRVSWIRDTSFTNQAFFHLGHYEDAEKFQNWNSDVIRRTGKPDEIQNFYAVHLDNNLNPRTVWRLTGYRNSKPVRIGNRAIQRREMDKFAELVHSIYDGARLERDAVEEHIPFLKDVVDHVCDSWQKKDKSIWEKRGKSEHFVYSKLMCWVAVDRGIRILELAGKGQNVPQHWFAVKEKIHQAILEKGFSPKRKAFTQAFDSDIIDASALLIPVYGFLPPDDPRVQGTINAALKTLVPRNGLVRRHEQDKLQSAFLLCSFWLVQALAISGRLEEAEDFFSHAVDYSSPLGLFAEEVEADTGKFCGNFPQAYSHVGLINAALYIDIMQGKEYKGPKPLGIP